MLLDAIYRRATLPTEKTIISRGYAKTSRRSILRDPSPCEGTRLDWHLLSKEN